MVVLSKAQNRNRKIEALIENLWELNKHDVEFKLEFKLEYGRWVLWRTKRVWLQLPKGNTLKLKNYQILSQSWHKFRHTISFSLRLGLTKKWSWGQFWRIGWHLAMRNQGPPSGMMKFCSGVVSRRLSRTFMLIIMVLSTKSRPWLD